MQRWRFIWTEIAAVEGSGQFECMVARQLTAYSTGLDWSGDPGEFGRDNRPNPYLVFAASHADSTAELWVRDELDRLRLRLGVDERYAFKYADATNKVRADVLSIADRIGTPASCLVVDKSNWNRQYLQSSSGTDRILDGIGALIAGLPDSVVCDQRFLVDSSRGEKDFIRRLKQRSKIENQHLGRANFGKIVPRPDHRSDAQLIQIADFVAGHVRSLLGRAATPESLEVSKVNITYI